MPQQTSAVMLFPGIDGVISGSFTISHGIAPSVAQIEVPPFTQFETEVGTLRLIGDGGSLDFPGCRIEKVTQAANDNLIITILDRRWRWRFGGAFALLNERTEDGGLRPGSEYAPQDIARELLNLMGETGFDIGDLPNETRPEMRFIGNNPASELESLCSSLGCSVVLWRDRVAIRRLGQGGSLPNNPLQSGQPVIDIPITPDSVAVISGPRDFQAMFSLEAVALEADGTVVPIEEASYRPTDGWETEWPEDFEGIEDEKERALALKSVFRWYRIKQEVDSDVVLDGRPFGVSEDVQKLDQILPILDGLNETETLPDGSVRPKGAKVEGLLMPGDEEYANRYGPVKENFSIDRERGLVQFSEPLFQIKRSGDSDHHHPAELYLTCRFNVKQESTNQLWRHQFTRPSGGRRWGTPPQIESRFDLIPKSTASYREGSERRPPRRESIADNTSEIERDLARHADAIISGFRWAAGEVRTWVGWWANFALDGAIRQVTYTFGEGGWFTSIAMNTEESSFLASTLAEQRALDAGRQRQKDRAIWLETHRRSKV